MDRDDLFSKSSRSYFVCSEHFSREMYKNKRLKPHAVPSLKLPRSEFLSCSTCEEKNVGTQVGEPTYLDKETDAKPEEVLRAVKVEPSGSENVPEDLMNTKRNIQDSPNTTTSKRLRKDSKSDEPNKKGDNKFENLSLDDQKNIGSFLEDLSANLRVLMSRHDDYFDDFGRYVAGRLRSLPQGKALELQPQIISMINAAGLENVASQDDDRDEGSPLRVVKIESENDESILDDLND